MQAMSSFLTNYPVFSAALAAPFFLNRLNPDPSGIIPPPPPPQGWTEHTLCPSSIIAWNMLNTLMHFWYFYLYIWWINSYWIFRLKFVVQSILILIRVCADSNSNVFWLTYLRYFVPQVPIIGKMLNGYLMFSVKNIVQNVRLIWSWGKNLVPLHFVISKS